jgi:glycosyltransferase involved in cell wall biosynthesis
MFAYSLSPYKGSESGAGWGLLEAVRQFADVTVLHGSPDAPELARYQQEDPDSGITFIHVPCARFPDPLHRNKLFRFLAYTRWTPRARSVASSLIDSGAFDAVHHATWSVYWLPSPARGLHLPVVWGPVGGAVVTPKALRETLSRKGLLAEWLDQVSVRLAALNPRTRAMWKQATVALFQNSATRTRVKRNRAADALLNHAEFTVAPPGAQAPPTNEVVWVGAVESRKAPLLAVRAMRHTGPEARLVVVGDGPQLEEVREVIDTYGLQTKVRTTGRIPRDEVQTLMAGARATLYTGLREEGGLALAEGLLSGTPVIVIGNGGPLALAEAATDRTRVQVIEPGDVETTERNLADAIDRAMVNAPVERTPMLDVDASIERLRQLFVLAIESRDVGSFPDTEGPASEEE